MTTPETAAAKEIEALRAQVEQYRAALELIASPIRPDGTWNRDRAACQQIAQEAIDKAGKA